MGVPRERFTSKVVWNGQKGGGSVVAACGGSQSGARKRQTGGSCPVQFPPEAPTLSFRTGGPQPTCASGSVCGSGCKGFFCEGNPLSQNPDFLDPRNPDSVQNPSGPYYNDWEGVITRSSSTTSTAPTSTSTTKPAPTGPIPTPGHGKATPSWAMVYYMLRDKNGETHGFYGYDDSNFIPCTVEPATWRKVGGQIGAVPSTLTGITVYGDTSCRFASSDMMLRCNNWAPATCVDRRSGENYGGGGTCKVDYGAGIYQYWNNIILCSW